MNKIKLSKLIPKQRYNNEKKKNLENHKKTTKEENKHPKFYYS